MDRGPMFSIPIVFAPMLHIIYTHSNEGYTEQYLVALLWALHMVLGSPDSISIHIEL